MAKRRGNGEGGIEQRESDGKWCASVDLGFVNGKRRRKVMYGKTRKEVADKLKALHRDQAAGINLAPEQYTVEQFLIGESRITEDHTFSRSASLVRIALNCV